MTFFSYTKTVHILNHIFYIIISIIMYAMNTPSSYNHSSISCELYNIVIIFLTYRFRAQLHITRLGSSKRKYIHHTNTTKT